MVNKNKKISYDTMFIVGLLIALVCVVALSIGGNAYWAVPFGIVGIVFIGVGKRTMKK